jgi:hypothetical protein
MVRPVPSLLEPSPSECPWLVPETGHTVMWDYSMGQVSFSLSRLLFFFSPSLLYLLFIIMFLIAGRSKHKSSKASFKAGFEGAPSYRAGQGAVAAARCKRDLL